ncbi:LOW QUALITY PROTEIN: Flp pilus assembly protein TadB [Liberibacter crescens BT-1]|uniref:Flp pilus assembly protein TadB n=1 Tax=Liberibacter crescens (strain BT-1) TaxID=1215343 RepID=L0EWD4_LIBCB|nr:LOW QUALITY PROTEIN: Flp pilus assembly protein TadB [Liberibacter crescens BT-1]
MFFDARILLLIVLVFIAIGSLCYGLLYTKIEQQEKSSVRFNRIKSEKGLKTSRSADSVNREKRRKVLQETIEKLEAEKNNKFVKSNNFKSLLLSAGLSIDINYFYGIIFGLAFIIFLFLFIAQFNMLACLSASFLTALVVPRFLLNYLIKNRQAKFLDELPNALDVVVRSVRSGLPLIDAIRLIATQSKQPLRNEFRRIVDSQQIGLSIPESISRMVRYMPIQEVSFFATVINIQAQSGGNLSEALSNLSKVLRDRKKMKAKVKALAMEAKASAWIIGSLPFVVSTLVYITSPQYIGVLFVDPRGHMILGIAGVLMLIGIFIMRIMINFDI